MILHQRRVLIIGPNELRAVAFSPSSLWLEKAERVAALLGVDARCFDSVVLAREHALDAWREGEAALLLCSACATLQPCSAYERSCETIAEAMSLLTLKEREPRVWGWVGPQSVIDLSGVAEDPGIDEKLKKIITHGPKEKEIVSSFKTIFENERKNVEKFLARAAGRIVRESSKTAEAVVTETMESVLKTGQQRFRDAFQEAPASGSSVSGDVSAAARLLGVRADADPAIIQAAYREMIKKHHPDANLNNQELSDQMTKRLNIARDTLLRARRGA